MSYISNNVKDTGLTDLYKFHILMQPKDTTITEETLLQFNIIHSQIFNNSNFEVCPQKGALKFVPENSTYFIHVSVNYDLFECKHMQYS